MKKIKPKPAPAAGAVPPDPRRNALLFFAALWGAAIFFLYHRTAWPNLDNLFGMLNQLHFPSTPAFGAAAGRLLLAGGISLLCVLLGRPALRAGKFSFASRLEENVFAAGLGSGLLALLLLGMGAAGFWRPRIIQVMAAGLTALGLFLEWRHRAASALLLSSTDPAPSHKLGRPLAAAASPRWRGTEKFLAALLAAMLGVYLFQALAPEIFYDSLVYHLAIPKLWLMEGRFTATPWNCLAAVPFQMEILFGLGLGLEGEVTAKLVHYAAGVGTLAAIYALARRHGSARGGLIAALLFAGAPMVALEFGKSAVELGTTLYVTLSAFALMIALGQQEADSPGGKRRWIALAGIFCGLNMATKYTAWVFYPALALPLLALDLRPAHPGEARRWKAALTNQLVLGLAAGAVILPWLLKNLWLFKNPLYPFLTKLFPNPESTLSNWDALRYDSGRNLAAQFGSVKGVFDFLAEPWTRTMSGRSDADFLGPAYLLFWPFLLLWRRRPGVPLLLAVFLLQWIFYAVFCNVPRYWIPCFGLLAALLGAALTSGDVPAWLRRGALIAAVAVSAVNLYWGGLYLFMMDGWRASLGDVSRAEYLNASHSTYPTPYFASADLINKASPANARVLVLGDSRAFYLERPFICSTVFDTNPVMRWANESPDGEALYAKIKERGLTHALVNVLEGVRTKHYWLETLTPQGRASFDQFWRAHARFVFQDRNQEPPAQRWTQVYEFSDRPAAPVDPVNGEPPNPLLMILDAAR